MDEDEEMDAPNAAAVYGTPPKSARSLFGGKRGTDRRSLRKRRQGRKTCKTWKMSKARKSRKNGKK
jgi:hypothetical protein